MYCTNCGAWNDPGVPACATCGVPLKSYYGSTQPAGMAEGYQTPEITPGQETVGKKAAGGAAPVSKTLIAVVVTAIVAVALTLLAVSYFAHLGPFAEDRNAHNGDDQREDQDTVDEEFDYDSTYFRVPFHLDTLVEESPDEALADLDKLEEFRTNIDDPAYTTSGESNRLIQIVHGNSDELLTDENQAAYAREHPWLIYLGDSRSTRDEVAESGEGINRVMFSGYCDDTGRTCEEYAQIISELFGYEGIVLYRYDGYHGTQCIKGYAIGTNSVAEIEGQQSVEGLFLLELDVGTIQDSLMGPYDVEEFANLYHDESLASTYDDYYIGGSDTSGAAARAEGDGEEVHQVMGVNHDQEAYDDWGTSKSRAIGSHFDVSFELGNLVTAPSPEVLAVFQGLYNERSTYEPDGVEKPYDDFTADAAMAYTIELSFDESLKGDEAETSKQIAWGMHISNDDEFSIGIDQLEGGSDVSEAYLWAQAAIGDPSCEEFANLLAEVYHYDSIVVYRDVSGILEGYAVGNGTVAQFQGHELTERPYIGTFSFHISVYNPGEASLGDFLVEQFEGAYNDTTLASSHEDYFIR